MNNITVIEKQINYLEDVVYNNLQPAGISIGGDGSESDLYYSKIQLDAGQLDNRYYTEGELYTRAQLNAGQLDTRYYTETEIGTWRNAVTQEEMGYLHGVTSSIQDQLDAAVITISGTPADNQLAVWTGATSIEGTNNLVYTATGLGVGTTSPQTIFHIAKDGQSNIRLSDTGAATDTEVDAILEYYRGTNTNRVGWIGYGSSSSTDLTITNLISGGDILLTPIAGNVGIGTAIPQSKLHVSSYDSGNSPSSATNMSVEGDTYSGLAITNSDSGAGYLMFGDSDDNIGYIKYDHSTNDMILRANNVANQLVLDSTGRVGIKNAAPSYGLDANCTGRFVNALYLDETIGTTNYESETIGWRGTYAGAFDFRSIYTDELIAKTFIADIDLALLSGTMVSKSITQVSRNFTVPAVDSTANLYVEAIPGFPTSKTFESGDYIRLQVINRTGGGLLWLKVYGTVDAGTLVDGGATGEQYYTFTTKYCGLAGAAEGETVYAGAGAQDLGVSGNGYIQSEAGDYNLSTPYIQTVTWETDPFTPANLKVRTRMGNLTGITNQTGFGLVTRKDNTNYISQWWNTDSDWGIRGVVAGAEVFKLGDENFIAGWTIDEEKISKDITANRHMRLNAKDDSYPEGFQLYRNNTDLSVDDPKVVQVGQLYEQGNSLSIGTDYGFQIKQLKAGPTYADLVYFGADARHIAGWNIDTDALYTGDKVVADDWSPTGITLASDGAIHAPNFYVNTGGEIGLRQVESVLFKTDAADNGIKISGTEIWENENPASSYTWINKYGYNGGDTQSRQTLIGNGKGISLGNFDGINNRVVLDADALWFKGTITIDDAVGIGGALDVTGAVDCDAQLSTGKGIGIGLAASATYPHLTIANDEASGYAANIQNDGNNINRYGLRIQCGMDTPTDADSHAIRFFDGNGSYLGALYFDSGHLAIDYASDAKLKENIKDQSIEGLSIIEQMQYRSFNWKRDIKKERTEVHGWIADEIEEIFPEMVGHDTETGIKTIKESKIIPVMIQSIKELNNKVKILESK